MALDGVYEARDTQRLKRMISSQDTMNLGLLEQ
jgi:hypothetical protein